MRLGTIIISVAAMLAADGARAAESPRPVRIAVVDTGVAPVRGLARVLEGGRDLAPMHRERLSSAHGTLVASIIQKRVDRPIRILPYRIDSDCVGDWCEMPVSRLAAAVRDATAQGVDIIQISSYGMLSQTALEALQAATQAGIHVVLCAGNDGRTSPYAVLASLNPMVHVVGALDAQGMRAEFSSRGGNDIVWRLGSDIFAYDDHGQERKVNGTSFAASVYTAEIVNRNDWSDRGRPATLRAVAVDTAPSVFLPRPHVMQQAVQTHADAVAAPPTEEIVRIRSHAVAPPEEFARPPAGMDAKTYTAEADAPLQKGSQSRALPPEPSVK